VVFFIHHTHLPDVKFQYYVITGYIIVCVCVRACVCVCVCVLYFAVVVALNDRAFVGVEVVFHVFCTQL